MQPTIYFQKHFCEFRLDMRFCFAKDATLMLRVLALRAENAMSLTIQLLQMKLLFPALHNIYSVCEQEREW